MGPRAGSGVPEAGWGRGYPSIGAACAWQDVHPQPPVAYQSSVRALTDESIMGVRVLLFLWL